MVRAKTLREEATRLTNKSKSLLRQVAVLKAVADLADTLDQAAFEGNCPTVSCDDCPACFRNESGGQVFCVYVELERVLNRYYSYRDSRAGADHEE